MIEEALSFLTTLGADANSAEKIETDSTDETVLLYRGQMLRIPKGIPPRSHRFDHLDSLVKVACEYFEKADSDPPNTTIWVAEERVTLVLDTNYRRENIGVMPMLKTEPFRKLEELAMTKPWMEQKDFIRLLRIDLAGTLPPVELLDRVRKVKFENSQITSGTVARDRESMGREINSRVDTSAEIPETVRLNAKVFEDFREIAIACAVEVDAMRGMFRLIPLPSELRSAITSILAIVHAEITEAVDDGISVYFGNP